jgi:hypothetical protein
MGHPLVSGLRLEVSCWAVYGIEAPDDLRTASITRRLGHPYSPEKSRGG